MNPTITPPAARLAQAVGALASGRRLLGKVTADKVRIRSLEVDELTVRKLNVQY